MSVRYPFINPYEEYMKGFMKSTYPFINPYKRVYEKSTNAKMVYERVYEKLRIPKKGLRKSL
jgi:hypothetical protein